MLEFNREEYWKNRRERKRGQGERIKPRIIPKGESVPYTTRENVEAQYPNAAGINMMRAPDGGFMYVSRKQARRRAVDRDFTRPNIRYRMSREIAPFKGHVRNLGKNPPIKLPIHDPKLSNHARMMIRAAQQEA